MIDEATLAQMNGKYVCPPDAGPAWRAAMEYGFDMSLIEATLKLTPEQRLQRLLDQQIRDADRKIEALRAKYGDLPQTAPTVSATTR